VPGDHRYVVHRQLLGRQQRRGHEQWLGLGGVLDLVGIRLGAEVNKIDAGQRGPPAQTRLGAGQREPRSQEAGLLGTLAG
jgi:hypothetical protein